jgi:hypothetical protein
MEIGKLAALDAQVRLLIKERNNQPMTEEEFLQQSDSFIVGNGFDVFADVETITSATVLASRKQRLIIAPFENGSY